ncbi:MAG: YlxR family protein [Armatimonadetes bacterium]|nr:YlxR family protein [Armatimonadota bacterium]MCX7968397.1 YlxR family protein [Armatimonadota bacterium]MDW8142279.1 YlxR family protein [Armatimonadota bacterium]
MLKRRRRKGDRNERLCLGCRQLRDKRNLVRVAAFRDGRVIIDEAKKLGGRGVYVCPYADCVIAATKKRGWGHGFKRPIDAKTLNELLSQLKRHILWMTGDLARLC